MYARSASATTIIIPSGENPRRKIYKTISVKRCLALRPRPAEVVTVSAFPLEELDSTFVLLRRLTGLESAKVAALSRLRVLFA